jgi:hypothetical protein
MPADALHTKSWCKGTLQVRHHFYGNPDTYSRVKLSGTVFTKLVPGPPTYGEDPRIDDRWPVAILRLDHPAPALLRDKYSFDPAETVPGELVEVDLDVDATPFKGHRRHVVADGVLYMSAATLSQRDVSLVDGTVRISPEHVCEGRLMTTIVPPELIEKHSNPK